LRKTEIPLERANHLPDEDPSLAEKIVREQRRTDAKERLFFKFRQDTDQDYWGATTTKSTRLPVGMMKTIEVGLGLSTLRGTPEGDFERAYFSGELLLSPTINLQARAEIYTQECVAQFKDGVAIIQLWNTGDEHITLKPGTKIAEATPYIWTKR